MNLLMPFIMGVSLTGAAPKDFLQAVTAAVSPPQVIMQGTTPASPLFSHGNTLERLLRGTPDIMAAACELIGTSQHELLLQNYEWEDDDASARLVLQALELRVARALLLENGPLRIRLLLDDSWPALSTKHRDKLKNFVSHLAQQPLAQHNVFVELASYHGFGFGILHSKTMVRDAHQAIVMTGNFKTNGGMATDYFNMGAVLAGPLVATVRDDWLSARHDSVRVVAAGSEPEVQPADGRQDDAASALPGFLDAAILSRRANPHWRDKGDENPQDRGLLALIGTAQEHIRVLNPALNVPGVMDAIVDAVVRRRVAVDLVLSLNMDRRFQRTFEGGDNAQSAYTMYNEILKAAGPGVANRLRIAWASSDGQHIASPADPGNVHAKAVSFDDTCLWVGSMNWDKQSWNNSRELNVVLFGETIAFDWQVSVFAPRFAMAVPIAAQDLPWQHRHKHNRVFDYLQGG